jgi:hypothetical protein
MWGEGGGGGGGCAIETKRNGDVIAAGDGRCDEHVAQDAARMSYNARSGCNTKALIKLLRARGAVETVAAAAAAACADT